MTDASKSNELDLVFLLDVTASMGSYIQAAKQNIKSIVEKIVANESADVRFGLVAYRDHPPQDSTFVTKVFDFTSSHKKMRENVDGLAPRGGGDGPEAVTAALDECLKMPYRKQATKIAVLIADAPPHGLGENGDGFPNGDPEGRDPIVLAKQMLELGIVVYAVGCEPALSNYKFARDFFAGIAKITEGTFLPLSSAKLLADAIIGGASEEFSMENLMEQVKKEEEAVRAEAKKNKEAEISEDEVIARIDRNLKSKKVQTSHLEVDDLYGGWDQSNVDAMYTSSSLASARKEWKPLAHAAPNISKGAPAAPGGGGGGGSGLRSFKPSSLFSFGKRSSAPTAASASLAPASLAPAPVAQQVSMKKAEVSSAQVSKMYHRAKSRHS